MSGRFTFAAKRMRSGRWYAVCRSHLALLPAFLPGTASAKFTYSTNKLSLPKLRKLNLSLPEGKPKLPEVDMPSGISMNFSMAFGKLKQFIALLKEPL